MRSSGKGQGSLPMTDPVTVTKTVCAGHSYGFEAPNVVGAGLANGLAVGLSAGSWHDRGNWPSILQDMFGAGADHKFYRVSIPSLGAAVDYVTSFMVEEDCLIDGVSYIPAGTAGLNASNYRALTVEAPLNGYSAPGTVVAYADTHAVGFSLGTEFPLLKLTNAGAPFIGNAAVAVRSGTSNANVALSATSPIVPGGGCINVKSTHVGTGVADPGGTMIIRTAGRFRSFCVGGASHAFSGIYTGGWAMSMNPAFALRAKYPHMLGIPINLTAAFNSTQATVGGTVSTVGSTITVASTTGFAASGTFSMWTNGGAVTVTYTGGGGGGTTFTGCTIGAGSQTYSSGFQCCNVTATCQAIPAPNVGTVQFPNGTKASMSSAAGGATTLTMAAVSGGNAGTAAVGQQGHIYTSGGGYDNITATQLAVLLSGANEMASQNLAAWRESIRAWVAFHASGAIYFDPANDKNYVDVAGNGAGATWAGYTPPAGGQFGGTIQRFTGAVGGTPPSRTLSLGPAFAGEILDLYFLGWAGSRGGTATIKVDGADPPNGPCTVQTGGMNNPQGATSINCTVANGAATLVRNDGGTWSINDIGKLVVGTNVPAGTFLTPTFAQLGTATANMSANASGANTGNYSMILCTPTVKRITGLSNGAHTVTITLTAMDATDGSAFFDYMGYSFEPNSSSTVPAPVAVVSVFHRPTGTNDTQITNANNEIQAVIAGTATPLGSSSQEPALSTGAFYVDVDSVVGASVVYFTSDNLHLNSAGQIVVGSTISTLLRKRYTQQQTIAR